MNIFHYPALGQQVFLPPAPQIVQITVVDDSEIHLAFLKAFKKTSSSTPYILISRGKLARQETVYWKTERLMVKNYKHNEFKSSLPDCYVYVTQVMFAQSWCMCIKTCNGSFHPLKCSVYWRVITFPRSKSSKALTNVAGEECRSRH